MVSEKMKPLCYKCIYRKKLIGSCHSYCSNNKAKVIGDEWGIKNGWFFHPFNFDPVWLKECNGFTEKTEKLELGNDTRQSI